MANSRSSVRADFISDGSSSDSDSLPEMGSLMERLAQKRKLLSAIKNDSLTECGKKTCTSNTKLNINRTTETGIKSYEVNNLSTTSDHVYRFKEASTGTEESVDLTEEDSDSNYAQETGVASSSQGSFGVTSSSQCESDYVREIGTASSSQGSVGESTTSSISVTKPAVQKDRKKRSAGEVEENKRKAQEKKDERERVKMAKEAEKQMRRVERESKKQVSLASCLKYVTVLVDTGVVNTCGCGAVLFRACEELGVACQTRELRVPYTIMWQRQATECNLGVDMRVETIHSQVEEKDVLSVVPATDFVQMVHAYKQSQRGLCEGGVSLRDNILQQKAQLTDCSITVIVLGLEQYFRDLKSQNQRKHKEAVLSTKPGSKPAAPSKAARSGPLVRVSRVEVEETVTDSQLQTGCCTLMVDTHEEMADLVRRFSKAVAEKPAKSERFEAVFSFHEEGVGGVKVDKYGGGLLKVWKQQLMQFKNLSPDIAQAIIAQFPSPRLLKQAYLKCSNEKEAIGVLENIVVRRGAGVLETARRIGKELSRRIYTFYTSEDPDLVIK